MRPCRGEPADDPWRPFELAPGVLAVFTTRYGGVSAPPFDSLNLGRGVGDDPVAVARNRGLVAEACLRPPSARPPSGISPSGISPSGLPADGIPAGGLTAGGIAWMRQVHGTDVAYVAAGTGSVAGSPGSPAAGNVVAVGGSGPVPGGSPHGAVGGSGPVPGGSPPAAPGDSGTAAGGRPVASPHAAWPALTQAPEVDAIFTGVPGLPLGVLVADCAPVLIADPQARIAGVAHAGREGMAGGVVLALVRAMTRAGADPSRLHAAVGPAICGGCYEVPAQLRSRIADAVPQAGCVTRKGSPGIDIRAGVIAQLAGAGVLTVRRDPRCTAETPALYSYRRDGRTGRFAGLLWLTP